MFEPIRLPALSGDTEGGGAGPELLGQVVDDELEFLVRPFGATHDHLLDDLLPGGA